MLHFQYLVANKQADVRVWKGPILIIVRYTPVKNPAKMLQRALEESWEARLILGLTRVLRNYARAWSPLCGLRPVLEGLRGHRDSIKQALMSPHL